MIYLRFTKSTFTASLHKKKHSISKQNLFDDKTSRWIWQELELCRVSMVEVTKAAPSMWGKRLQTHGTFSQSLIWKVSPTKVTINANLGFENLKEIFRCFLHSSVLFVCFHTRHTPHNFAMSQWLHRTGVNKNLHTSLGHTARKGESRESRESKQSRAGFSERFPIEVCRSEYKNYKTNAFYQLLSFFCFFLLFFWVLTKSESVSFVSENLTDASGHFQRTKEKVLGISENQQTSSLFSQICQRLPEQWYFFTWKQNKNSQIHVCEVINTKKRITFLGVFLNQIVDAFFFCEVRIWRRMRIKHKRPKLCKAQASHKSFALSPTRISKKNTSLEWPYMANSINGYILIYFFPSSFHGLREAVCLYIHISYIYISYIYIIYIYIIYIYIIIYNLKYIYIYTYISHIYI